MDIVTRLKKFMDHAGISSSQFADTCEIPRPTLSQLLNGRNKKVSDEVIGKIHRAYPSLNVMWLMFGDGEMLLQGGDMLAQGANAASATDHDTRVDDSVQRAISFDGDDATSSFTRSAKQPQRVGTAPTMSETIQSIMRTARGSQRGTTGGERRVVKMLVFYSDGRFEEFGPAHPS